MYAITIEADRETPLKQSTGSWLMCIAASNELWWYRKRVSDVIAGICEVEEDIAALRSIGCQSRSSATTQSVEYSINRLGRQQTGPQTSPT